MKLAFLRICEFRQVVMAEFEDIAKTRPIIPHISTADQCGWQQAGKLAHKAAEGAVAGRAIDPIKIGQQR